MSERYTHQLLKVVVAQVCQTIGWHSIQSTPLELLIDILDQYLRDITRLTHRYSELYNRTDPNLDDVALAFREIGMSLGELQEYLQFVDPIERPFEVPRYPLPKDSHLNFLKPGSKEVLTRPVHIPEHMPPMLVDSEEEQEEARRRMLRLRNEPRIMEEGEAVEEMDGADFGGMVVEKMEEVGAEEVAIMETSQSEDVVTFKRPPEVVLKNEEGRPTREISSVIMTTSGFISPAREGKLPDSKIPDIPEEKPKLPPPPPPAPVLPVAKMDEKFGGKKGKKRPAEKEKKKDKKGDKKKEGGGESRPASRPATPTADLPPSSVTEDIKPLVEAPPEELPKEPVQVPDVKPAPETLVPPAPEVQPPAIPPIVPVTPSKIKKEKPKRKKPPLKAPQPPPHMMMNSPLMDVGLFPPQMPFQQSPATQPQQPPPLIPPMALMNQITPPKPPKPKRPKITKKQLLAQQQQQFQPPLNAQNILDIMTGNSGAKMPPNLFAPSVQPPSLFPPQQQQQTQLHAAQTQLDILQKLHPSLEITPAPGPASPEKHKLNVFKKVAKTKTSPNPPLTSSGPIIVIDDDKSPPHQPQFPITPMAKKRANTKNTPSTGGFQFQDTLSSPDFAMNPEMGPSSSSFREFSPPKTPSNMPKTPDIKLQSSSSSSTSWMSDSGKLSGGPGPLFGDFPPNFGLGMMPAMPKEEKKKKPRQRPVKDVPSKKSKSAQLMDEMMHQFQQQQQQQQQLQPVLSGLDKKQLSEYSKLLNQAMPPGAAALFNNPAVRNPMFGMFPLPSGPGLIPDNPLFGTFPGQPSFLPTGPFGMPSIPPRFDLNMLRYPRPPKPTPPETFDNLDPETKLAHTPLDLQKSTCNVAPLVPPSLQIEPTPPPQKSLPSPSIPRHPPPQEQSLNLSTKPSVIPSNPAPTHEPHREPTIISAASTLSGVTNQPPPPPPPLQMVQQLAAPAPNVPPITPGETIVIGSDSDTNSQSEQIPMGGGVGDGGGEEEGQPGELMGSAKKDKSEKRKNKEHKKDKKLKEGKIKKKKDKKDKNKSKDRDRERPKSSHSFHLDSEFGGPSTAIGATLNSSFTSPDHHSPPPSATVIPAGFLIDPNATGLPVNPAPTPVPPTLPPPPPSSDQPDVTTLEAIRRKEKKEKKKEKMKKEKRKEKERAAAAAAELGGMLGSPMPGVPPGSSGSDYTDASQPSTAATSVPKLMLKLGPGSRAGTPEVHQQQVQPEVGGESKREASPELARISALVTRPPKLKTPGNKSGGKPKEDEPKVGSKSGLESKAAGKLDFSGDPAKPRPRGIQALPDTIDLFSVTPSVATPSKISPLAPAITVPGLQVPGPSGADLTTPHSSKKPPKEPKSSSKSHGGGAGGSSSSISSVVPSLGVAIPAPLSTPITQLKDSDGNVVWICPACGRVDDGTPMIGCDGCDAWYHWVCVGIQVPPDSNEDWYCRVCIGRKQQGGDTERQKKRKKKDKRNPKD